MSDTFKRGRNLITLRHSCEKKWTWTLGRVLQDLCKDSNDEYLRQTVDAMG